MCVLECECGRPSVSVVGTVEYDSAVSCISSNEDDGDEYDYEEQEGLGDDDMALG